MTFFHSLTHDNYHSIDRHMAYVLGLKFSRLADSSIKSKT